MLFLRGAEDVRKEALDKLQSSRAIAVDATEQPPQPKDEIHFIRHRTLGLVRNGKFASFFPLSPCTEKVSENFPCLPTTASRVQRQGEE